MTRGTDVGYRGGPFRATSGQSTRRATSGPVRGGPFTVWPRMTSLERDLFVIGAALVGVVLVCGAAIGVVVDQLLHRND